MKERPILFSAPMVRALLDGRKTMTRRVIKPQPESGNYFQLRHTGNWLTRWVGIEADEDAPQFACPYGLPGDRLWVRETFWQWGRWMKNGMTKTGKQAWKFKASSDRIDDAGLPAVRFEINRVEEFSRGRETRHDGWIKRPSIFMPRWASRITLEIVSVRVERVQEISAQDAKAEGVRQPVPGSCYRHVLRDCYRCGFESLWNSINAKRGYGWAVNPWCWVIEFKQIGGAP